MLENMIIIVIYNYVKLKHHYASDFICLFMWTLNTQCHVHFCTLLTFSPSLSKTWIQQSVFSADCLAEPLVNVSRRKVIRVWKHHHARPSHVRVIMQQIKTNDSNEANTDGYFGFYNTFIPVHAKLRLLSKMSLSVPWYCPDYIHLDVIMPWYPAFNWLRALSLVFKSV